MVNSQSPNVLIVGGGASGAISAIALISAGLSADAIDIAEPRENLAEGLAYQTRDPYHRLNVPTNKMSAIEELPNDFVQWSSAPAYSFMERQTYGAYLRERLGPIHHIKDSVINLVGDREIEATFSSGGKKTYTSVVLAMGHGNASIPEFLKGVPKSPKIILDIWDGTAVPESKALICFGTGLSFIDVAMTHLSRDPNNSVIAISGSGNLPERHVQSPIKPFSPSLEEVDTLEKLRNYLAKAGESWREAVDGLRPITEAMWRGFTNQEREDFLIKDGSAWSRRRHRIAPDVADAVAAEIASGRMTIKKGQVQSVEVTEKNVTVELADGKKIRGDYLAICIGRDYELSDPLTLSLLQSQSTLRGPLNMGLSVDVTTGRLQNPDGVAHANIYAIGPLRSGEAFESTAIPEIRRQAAAIARCIIEDQSGTNLKAR